MDERDEAEAVEEDDGPKLLDVVAVEEDVVDVEASDEVSASEDTVEDARSDEVEATLLSVDGAAVCCESGKYKEFLRGRDEPIHPGMRTSDMVEMVALGLVLTLRSYHFSASRSEAGEATYFGMQYESPGDKCSIDSGPNREQLTHVAI